MLFTTSYGELTRFLGVLAGNTLDILSDITDQLSPYFDGGLVVNFLSISLSQYTVNYLGFFVGRPTVYNIDDLPVVHVSFIDMFSGVSTSSVLIFCRDYSKGIYSVFFLAFRFE